MIKHKALLIVAAALLAGCVSKGKHEALQAKYKAQTEVLETKELEIQNLEQAIAEEEAKLKELNNQLAALKEKVRLTEEEVASMEAEKVRVEGELAAVVKDRARLKSSAEELSQALSELGKRKAEAEKRVAQFRDLLNRFRSLIDAGKLKVKITDGRMILELPTDVLFASGRADLSEDGIVSITQIGEVLAAIPDRRYQIEGHTDNVPISTARYPSNWELAAARALTVLKTLREAGMQGSTLSAASFGEFRPVASNNSDAGRRANRRIEIVIVPDLSSLPGFDELNSAVDGQ
ncbi:OmpA/MotB family protein [Haliangium ochraceum]|uniref:OmpA/MotB domain protein n=1 Tax=Haliangium ochraceum (strain DSM 14365 / JCM 11303 / SMP-2) TaxID=502025 RepID=D0LQE1_HALO1|nr:OmpA family protein [Haliangium ochraceum]ACY18950.1 OmpA/MotB domain protein [Haliangium ochraceum DSM 14365]